MARARNIKPGFFKNEFLAEMPPETRLLFIGLWLLADREGRLEDRPKRIRAEIFPLEMIDAEPMLARLSDDKFITRYEVDGVRYIQIENFGKHQMPHHKEVASAIPAPPGCPQVTRHAYNVPANVRAEVFRRDGDRCLKCGAEECLSIDHITPLACGGDNEITNLQTLCKSCNSSKGDTTKDYRIINVDSTLTQRKDNDGASCPSDSLIPDSLIPDSLIRDQEHVQPGQAGQDALALEPTSGRGQGKTKPGTPKPDPLEGFDEFYRLYPRRQKRADAEKAWRKLSPADRSAAMQALPAHCANPDWLKDNGQFVPLPASWLNGKRWQDELDSAIASAAQAPVDEIVDLYHELCPNLAPITTTDPKRRSLINERWAENQVHQGLDFWRAFFETARSVPQLYHRGAMRAPYLDSMLERENFRAIVEDRTNA